MPVRAIRAKGGGGSIRQIIVAALVAVIALFFLPLFLVRGERIYHGGGGQEERLPEGVLPIDRAAEPAMASRDRGRAVRLQRLDGSVVNMTLEEYLWGVVAAEMPASFQQEALKAQACAARTYTIIQQNAAAGKHTDADICGDSTCCQAYVERAAAEARWGLNAPDYAAKIQTAVRGTDGLGILYQQTPIQALYFSSAPGRTADAVEVWGNTVDYLVSVDSPEGEEVPNYHSQLILTAEEVKHLTLERYPGADLSGAPEGWFSAVDFSASGLVSSLSLGGVSLTGGQVRSLFSLRSAFFTVSCAQGQFTFDVTGYGHGVGMSQYGANAMAKAGSGFADILTWYYSGTQVDYLW